MKHWQGSLFVKSTPVGAEVYIDDIAKGVTPLKIDQLRTGDYTIKLKLISYLSESLLVNIKKDTAYEVTANLTSVNSVEKEIAELEKQKLYYFAGSAVALATALVFNLLANNNYDDYQTAGANASELHKTIETQMLMARLFAAVGIGGVIPAVKYYYDQSRLQIQLNKVGE